MRLRPPLLVCLYLGLALDAGGAHAAPELSVDLDPGAPGVQSDVTVSVGEVRGIAIVISGLKAQAPLHAYELDLDFDAGVVSASAAADAGLLAGTVQVLEADVAAPDVNLAAFTEGPDATAADGVLATASFRAEAAGVTTLSLGDVILSAPFGSPIPGVGLRDATLRVPEPSLALGALLAGLILAGRARRRSRRR